MKGRMMKTDKLEAGQGADGNSPTRRGIIERVTIMSGPLTGMVFLRHTIDIAPADGTVGFVEGEGWRCAGKFRDGEWRRMTGTAFARQVTHWSILDPEMRT